MVINPFKKETSCPFPIMQYNVGIFYNEVKKPSGIAYILLELVQKYGDKEGEMMQVLKSFGIPHELHYLFAEVMENLCATGIVDCNVRNIKGYFDMMTVGDFTLTAKGLKMFKDEAIPTGNERKKEPVPEILYSPVRRSFSFKSSQRLIKIEKTFLGEKFARGIECDVSNMEDWINRNKSDSQIKLKQDEKIVRVDIGSPKFLAELYDKNMTVCIDNDGVEFSFNSSDQKEFFKKYYSSEFMTQGMLAKDNYTFKSSVPTVEWSGFNANSLCIPSEAINKVKAPCKLFVERGKHGYDRSDKVLKINGANELLDVLDGNAEFALLDDSGCKYYCPLNIKLHCKNFGDTFEMQLLAEFIASEEQFKRLLREIYRDCREAKVSSDSISRVAYVAKAMGDANLMDEYTKIKLDEFDTYEEQIDVLIRINGVFSKCDGWKDSFDTMSSEMFESYLKTVDLGNVIEKNAVLSRLREAMGMSKTKHVAKLAARLRESESDELVYQALETAEFTEKEILSAVNMISTYAECVLERTPIDGNTRLAGKFKLFSVNMWKLCDMLGVEDADEYTLRDDYNVEEFFNAFATYSNAKKALEEYRAYAGEEYGRFDRYARIFEPIHDLLAIEKSASEHPERITKKSVDELIARARYTEAIGHLHIKLQYDLRKKLSAEPYVQANELIDRAKDDGIITDVEANDLHELRKCRNGLHHPEAKQIPYNKASIEKWRDRVFPQKGEVK